MDSESAIIFGTVMLPVGFIVGCSMSDFDKAHEWIIAHPRTDFSAYEETLRGGSLSYRLAVTLGSPGRRLAKYLYYDENNSGRDLRR